MRRCGTASAENPVKRSSVRGAGITLSRHPWRADIGQLPVLFFNSIGDSASKLWGQLNDQVGIIRQYQVERIARFVGLSENLVTNADVARIQQARMAIAAEALAMA